jgi:drug/metabolite transporter (DMT)-like permease
VIGCARLRREPWPEWRETRGAAIAGVFFLGLANGAIMLAERTVPSGFAALIAATTPLVLAVMERFRREGERPGTATNAGLLMGFGGAAVLLLPALTGQTAAGNPADVALLLAAPFFWAYGQTYARSHPMPPGLLMSAGIQALAVIRQSVCTSGTSWDDAALAGTAGRIEGDPLPPFLERFATEV